MSILKRSASEIVQDARIHFAVHADSDQYLILNINPFGEPYSFWCPRDWAEGDTLEEMLLEMQQLGE